MNTTLDSSLRNMELSAAYDAACKRVLSEKRILAWILKSTVSEFMNLTIEEIADHCIDGIPQIGEVHVLPDETNSRLSSVGGEDASVTEGTVTYDIRFYATVPHSGDKIRLIINIEAQNDFYPGYPLVKRGIYYCSRLISAQYGTEFLNAHYENIRKVYSIWVCMKPPKNRQNTITQYSVTEKNLIGHICEDPNNYDLMTVIMICLGNPDTEEYQGLLRLLDVLFSRDTDHSEKRRILEQDYNIPMSTGLETEVSEMCNLSKGIWEDGANEGYSRGIEKGIEKGIERGITKGLLDSVMRLMETMSWTAEQAMDALQIPEADRIRFRETLKQ